MIRSLILASLLFVWGATPGSAQQWASKMFKVTNHDFGSVAKGSKSEYRFELQNLYEEEVHIADVRTSCGCTTPSVEKRTLKTWEKGEIIATFNTRSFDGKRGATITVVFDKPFYAEVQLRVDGYVRRDVVFDPGQVELGEIDQGSTAEKIVRVEYAGRTDWKIVDVRSAYEHFEVELNENARQNGRVSYEMTVRLKPGAPAGYIQDQLTLVTDDSHGGNIPLPVTGRVNPPVTVSPALLTLGTVTPGETVTKQIVVKGKTPFKVTGVKCQDGCFQFKVSEEAKTLHLIPVTFKAGESDSKIEQKIEIETDLGSGVKACCVATATVKAGEATVTAVDEE